jgi:hypothetical protein
MTSASNITVKLQQELEHGERLLWTGQPRRGLMLRPSDRYLIPFSLLWGGFSIFWEWSVIQMGAPWFFVLFGAVFVLFGLHFIVGRFFVDAWQRARTFYGVTDRRVLIISGRSTQETTSLDLESLPDLSLSERYDGEGTISFGRDYPPYGWFQFSNWPGTKGYWTPRFEGVKNVRQVYELIRKAQRDSRKR